MLIAGSAFAAVLATIGLAEANYTFAPSHVRAPAPPAHLNYTLVEPLSGSNRVYGTVTARDGRTHEGFLRWDRNEGSWGDMLDLTKLDRGFTGLSGIRFGHVRHIRSLGSNHALFTLRSGHQVGMQGRSTDLGRAMRDLEITSLSDGQTSLQWDDLAFVRFHGTDSEVSWNDFDGGAQLRGTVITTSGDELSGDIKWDLDEYQSWEMLNGNVRGAELDVEFSNIARIVKYEHGSAVVLRDGRSLTLSGSNDVDSGHRGILVTSGDQSRTVKWADFRELRLDW